MKIITHRAGLSMAAGMKRLLLSVVLSVIVPVANAAVVLSDDVLNVEWFRFAVSALDQSTVNIGPDATVFNVMAWDDSTVNLNGGSVKGVIAGGNADINANWGSISTIMAFGDSSLTLNNIHGLDFLLMTGNTELEMFANDVAFDGRYLSGSWKDGSAFNIQTFNLTGVTTNGLPGYLTVSAVRAVPVPAAIWLFSSAFFGLALVGRNRTPSAKI